MFYDPVITVHPDKLFFECFSLDESSYGRLTCDLSMFSSIEKQATGTTNVDYSQALYDEFQKSVPTRTLSLPLIQLDLKCKQTWMKTVTSRKNRPPRIVGSWFPSGICCNANPSHRIRLHPLDLHKLCLFLRKNKELEGQKHPVPVNTR